MSTKIADNSHPAGSVGVLSAAFAQAITQELRSPTAATMWRTEVRGEINSAKAVEADRQSERVRAVRYAVDLAGDPQQILSTGNAIANSVSMINHMVCGPIPIPVAGRGEGGGTALFFDEDGFYGDLEINGSTVEYFIKLSSGQEVCDTEEIVDGRVPRRLLGHLYRSFARSR